MSLPKSAAWWGGRPTANLTIRAMLTRWCVLVQTTWDRVFHLTAGRGRATMHLVLFVQATRLASVFVAGRLFFIALSFWSLEL